jgi:glucose/arabinose dehydrogenase
MLSTRIRLTAALAAALALVLAASLPTSAGTVSYTATKVAGGLSSPVGFTFGPGNRIWYVEKSGAEVRLIDLDNGSNRRFYQFTGVNAAGERGVLGIGLHPTYPTKPFVFVYVTRREGDGPLQNQVVRLKNVNGEGRFPRIILRSPIDQATNHNGGRILFGPDGMLYVVIGDGGVDEGTAQDLDEKRGKILRLTPMGEAPSDNPIPGNRLFSYGHRNSFGFAFDPQTDVIWESENGPACVDEMNMISPGANYGWGPSQTCEGPDPDGTNQDGPSPVFPEKWYTPTIAPTGVAFCESCSLGAGDEGALFFGAHKGGAIRRLTLDAARDDVAGQSIVYTHPTGSVLSMEVAPDGRIYFSDFSAIWRLRLA